MAINLIAGRTLSQSGVQLRRMAVNRVLAAGSIRSVARADIQTSIHWPENSLIFEPAWESSFFGIPKVFMVLPNTFETYFTMREAQKLIGQKLELKDADDFNTYFMDRFSQLHEEVEALRRSKAKASVMAVVASIKSAKAPQAATHHNTAPKSSGSLDLATADARSAWTLERPTNAKSWDLTPYNCEVVQARRAEHNGRGWLQITVKIEAEEKWVIQNSNNSPVDLRIRQHLIVFEIPRESESVHDFRIAAFHTLPPPA